MVLTANDFFNLPSQRVSLADEATFFSSIKVGNNTFKKTGGGRFMALDAALVRYLAGPSPRIGELLDIGVSSGITTLDLDAALTTAGHLFRVTATDLALDAFIVPIRKGWRALVDSAGHPLQYDIGGHAIRPWRRRLDWLDGMAVVLWLLNWYAKPRARRSLASNRVVQRVQLLSPRLLRRKDITVVRDDITVENPAFSGRFDLIRAANILNLDYFDTPTLRAALANLTSYLSGPGALLLVARTLGDDDHHGTLFEIVEQGDGFRIVERYGNGSEVEALVLETLPRHPTRRHAPERSGA
jgi:hypothetical protein